jgi:hypothetical protein
MATGWTTEDSEFESRYIQEFLLFHIVQTGSGIHTASSPMGTNEGGGGDSFLWGKAAGAWSSPLYSN